MKWFVKKYLLILLGLALAAIPISSIYSQDAIVEPPVESLSQVDAGGPKWYDKILAMDRYALDPRAGLLYSPLIPVGNVNEVDFGALGISAYFSINTPLELFVPLKKYNLRTRMGLLTGYQGFGVSTNTSTGSIGLVPLLFHFALYYDIPKFTDKINLSASFKYNTGMIFSSMDSSVKPEYRSKLNGKPASISGSYVGYANQWTLGTEMVYNKLPQLVYFVDFGFLLHTEELSGTFVSMSLGVAWHFFSSGASPVQTNTVVDAETEI